MEYSNNLSPKRAKHPLSWISIILIILFAVWFQFYGSLWEKGRVIEWDVVSYYAYLPALFVHKDISLSFIDQDRINHSQNFWPSTTPCGNYIIRTTMGMAILYSPFFFVAHAVAGPLGFEPCGFSLPYRVALSLGAIIYLLGGLILLRRIMLKRFSDTAVAITLLLITVGTNLFYYSTIEPAMPHLYGFVLFVLFVYLTEKWINRATLANTVLLGLTCGLLSLVRPTNTLIGILFLLWGVNSFPLLKERIFLLLSRWKFILVLIFVSLLIWTPQMLYWQMQTGQLLFNSYIGYQFFFLSPEIFQGLFGFRKGLFIYTPILVLAFAGLLFLRRYYSGTTLPIIAFQALNIYIVLSWCIWWYGGSYGHRAFIESFALMSVPLAAFVQWTLERQKTSRIVLLILMTVLLSHSVFQTFQYYYGAIHWDSMTRQAYFDSFGRLKPSSDFHSLISPPDYEMARLGKPERKLTDWLNWDKNPDTIKHNIVVPDNTEFFELYNKVQNNFDTQPKINVKLFGDKSMVPEDLLLALSIHDSLEKILFYRDIRVRQEMTDINGTEQLRWTMPIDISLLPKSRLKVFLWSQEKKGYTLDSVYVFISGIY